MRSYRDRISTLGGLAASLALFGTPVWAQTAAPAKPPAAMSTPAPAIARLPPAPCAPVETLIGAGNLAWSDFDDDTAAADFSRAILQAPRCAAAWLRRAELRHENGEDVSALADAKVAVVMAPRNAEAYALLGRIEMRPFPDGATSLDYGKDAERKRAQVGIADLSHAIDLGLKDVRILVMRAAAYDVLGDYDRAIADCDSANALDPGKIEVLVARGNIWLDKGDRDRAQADFARARAIDPDNERGYTSAADAYEAAGDHAAAIAVLGDGIARPSPGRSLYRARAEIYQDMGDFPHAIADRTAVIDAASLPRSYDYRDRAETYAGAGDLDHALTDADMAVILDPKDTEAYTTRGEIEVRAGRGDAASQDFDRARALDPRRSAYIANDACWTRATAGIDLDKALADCNAAVAQKPKYSDALDSRGFVHFRLGQYDAAIADYTAALALTPKQASSLFGRGLAEQKKRMTAEAAADLAAARAADARIDETFKAYGIKAD